MNRRLFLSQSFSAATAFGTAALVSAQVSTSAKTPAIPGAEPKRGAPFPLALVKEFVGAGHGNLPRVKEMLAERPKLVLASYDWGSGDFETALGGAAHTGRREVALHLLDAGARIDAFASAMLGEAEIVSALLRLSPATANTRGPHGYSLLYHAGYNGSVAIAEMIAAHVRERSRDFNQTLHAATSRGHGELVAWLLKNGVDNPNTKNFAGKTALDVALQQKNDGLAQVLRAAGGITSS